MNVGILGSGAVGQALGDGFLKYGHDVMIGTRSPEKLADWKKKAGPKARVGNLADTAAFGKLIVLAAKGTAAKNTLSMAGGTNLDGKIVMDATNPIADEAPKDGVLKFFTTTDKSLMEDLQATYPKARFVKAFNSIGSAFMVNPDFGGQKPTMFICGNDPSAKKEVAALVQQFGLDAEDMGPAASARALEPLCILWCLPGFLRNEWTHAFKLLKK
jgi:predicted dinucleotide-binding enzyme